MLLSDCTEQSRGVRTLPVQRTDRIMLGMSREEARLQGCPYFCPAEPHNCYFEKLAQMQSERIKNRNTVAIPKPHYAALQRVLPHPRSGLRRPRGRNNPANLLPYRVQQLVDQRREGEGSQGIRPSSPIKSPTFREFLLATDRQLAIQHSDDVPPPYTDENWG